MDTVYNLASQTVKNFISGINYVPAVSGDDIQRVYANFREKFSPEKLSELSDENILSYIFLTADGLNNSLCYFLEFDPQIKGYFGSISGGSSYKFGLFQMQETKEWRAGSGQQPEPLTEEEALQRGKAIRDMLVSGCESIKSKNLETVDDYVQLEESLKQILGSYWNYAWIQKYFQMIFPDAFVCWYSEDFMDHYLYALGISPVGSRYVKNGQLNIVRRGVNILPTHFGEILCKMYGENAIRFIRLGSSENNGTNYAGDWKIKSIVAIGWNDVGDLSNYLKNGSVDRKALKEKLESIYYCEDKALASRKAGEIQLFYGASISDVFVIMDGEKLISFVDQLSPYYYDSNEHMAHCRRGIWKDLFDENEKLPESEGILTTCVEIKKDVNLRFLYKKYYGVSVHHADLSDSQSFTPPVYETHYQSKFARNRIIFGAPGTGKSYTLNKESKELLTEQYENNYERVTFHPDYAYANFVGTYKPVPKGDDIITYEYVPGPFMRVFVNAIKSGKTGSAAPYLLIIEEINRANVAAVFGDIFQLLDRDKSEASEYPIHVSEDIRNYLAKKLGGAASDYNQIRIPDNMFIWATMNSADQGVFPMDTAFKRRWDFTYIGIDENDEKLRGKTVTLGTGEYRRIVEWNSLRQKINDRLSSFRINEDKLLGPYFLSKKIVPTDGEIKEAEFVSAFKNKVLMYLFDDAGKQKRASLFAEGIDSTRYSEVCKAFDEKGIYAFCVEISSKVNATIPPQGDDQ